MAEGRLSSTVKKKNTSKDQVEKMVQQVHQEEKTMKVTSLKISEELLRKAKIKAIQEGMTFGSYVNKVLSDAIGK